MTLPGTVPDKLQPNDVEAEEAVIGSILIDPDAILFVVGILQPSDFFIKRHSWIFEALVFLFRENMGIDLITISDYLTGIGRLDDIGGDDYLTGLINATPTSIHAEFYANIVKEKAILRKLIEGAGDIARSAFRPGADPAQILDKAESTIFSIANSSQKESGPKLITSGLDKFNAMLDAGVVPSIPTGLIDLDRILGGLYPAEYYLLAARPSMGKTSLALNIALYAARQQGKKVAIFSLEMSDQQLVQRLVASESGVDSHKIRLGTLNTTEMADVRAAGNSLRDLPIRIDDTGGISILELRARARRIKAESGLDLLVIDYLQLMRGDGENQNILVSNISKGLKAIAMELDIPVLVLSQLNREPEKRQNKRPILADLRDSGSLEQDADTVIFIYRDEVYNEETDLPNVAELIIRKHRLGPIGQAEVYFRKHTNKFFDLEESTVALEVEKGFSQYQQVNGAH